MRRVSITHAVVLTCAGAFDLHTLLLDNNQLHSTQEIRALSLLDKLGTLTLAGNPIIARLGPRAIDVLARNSCPSLQTLDGRTLAAGRRSMPVLEASEATTGRVLSRGRNVLPVPFWTGGADLDEAQEIRGEAGEAVAQHVTLQPITQVLSSIYPDILLTFTRMLI